MTYIGRLDASEAASALSLLGRACAVDRVVRTGLSVAATDEARSAAASLMDMRCIRRGPEGEDRFPLAIRASEREDGRLLSVELHPLMLGREALAAFVGHVVGGIPGRLVRRAWGRWNEVVSEPTEQLMEAVGAGHMRFPQFGEEVLKAGLSRAAVVAGLSFGVSTERGGRGSKVVRVALEIGAPPSWIPGGGPDIPGIEVEPVGARLAAADRAELYRLAYLGVIGGRAPSLTMTTVMNWLSTSSDEADRRLSEVAEACVVRGGMAPAATAVEGVLLSLPNHADGLRMLSEFPWPDEVCGPISAKAWALRATACLALSGFDADAGLRALRGAVDIDERAEIIAAEDATALRSTFECLLEMVRDPSPESGSLAGILNRRERMILVSAADGPSAARVLEALAAATSRRPE